jgi:metal-responsive CopG/Arc/MetJ family transcriptional regulator
MASTKQKAGRKPVPMPRVQVTVSLPYDLIERLDTAAAIEDRSRSKLVEIIVREYLETGRP